MPFLEEGKSGKSVDGTVSKLGRPLAGVTKSVAAAASKGVVERHRCGDATSKDLILVLVQRLDKFLINSSELLALRYLSNFNYLHGYHINLFYSLADRV